MGAFAMTCAVSGLPIEAGDSVRYSLLTQSPYTRSNCHIHDLWFPRTWPLLAKYNDYGSVEGIEGGVAQQAWLDAFKIDLKTRGIGDNSVHDVATSKNMTFGQMLEGIWKGRIVVKRELDLWAAEPERQEAIRRRERKEKGLQAVPKGIPTVKRVTTTLLKAGYQVNTGNYGEGVLVDLRRYGHVRVRTGSDKDKDLVKVEKLFSRYATVVRAGTGNYADEGELLLCPKMGTEGYHGGRSKSTKGLPVAQMLIREDVWQAICTLRIENAWWVDRKEKTISVDDYRTSARFVWDTLTKGGVEDTRYELERGFAGAFEMNPVPFSWGLSSSFKWVARKFRLGEMAEAEVQPFLDTAAEFAFLELYLGTVRHMWRPSYGNGPQFGEWEMHRSFFEQLSKVARENVLKTQREQL